VDEMESLGKYLKKERENRKISLKEVAKNIKVRENFLRSVEEDRHDLLPSPTYVKGFLSAYAKYLGLDPNEVILRYENFFKGEPVPREEVPSEEKISWSKKYLWGIGGVIVVGMVASYFLFFNLSKPSIEPVSPKLEVKETPRPAPPPPTARKPSVLEEKPITLQLEAAERTWASVQVDDQNEYDITLQAGEGISYGAMKRIQLIVGNAGGLDITFNGKRLERFGKSGEVVTLIFTPQGVEAKPRETTKPPEE
jgi:transcriptional regulator with XRE-family HTH domain